MCGIAGIFRPNERQVHSNELKAMTDVIVHRGPDGEGYWTKDNIGFGHRRLSIIDLSDNANQPMHFANERYTITYNGEIYNYLELREKLISKGYSFRSKSDTEVILALYDQKKESFLKDLDGMFAMAIWDDKEKSLFCARDRFGEKPFYYSYSNGNLYFCSEMKGLWAAGIKKELDPHMAEHYMLSGRVTKNENTSTFYKGIKQLEAAHYMIVREGKQPEISRYYEINISKCETLNEDQAIEKFSEIFTKSVSLRLRADVTVGSSLSGGLDSSSIVMMIDKLKNESARQNTFSARFKDFSKDEGEHIHQVIKVCKNVLGHEIYPSNEEMQSDFEKLKWHQEEPFASASIFAQWKVMSLAKHHKTIVLLDGQGADEYLAGYLPYYRTYFKQLYFTNKSHYKNEFKSYNNLRDNSAVSVEEQETLRMKIGRIKKKLLNQPLPYNSDSLSNELKTHVQSFGLKELLRYADRNAMAHSREVRLPFLSHHLVDYVFSLPDNMKLRNGYTKYILRKSMESILPKSITWRIDKIGYEPPQSNWLANDFWRAKIESGKKIQASYFGKNVKQQPEWNYLMIDSFLK
jgi:asparagine synthase (glutamine-hydrolysing)